MRTVAVVLGGGSGERFGTGVPKQLLPLAGRPVIEKLKGHPLFAHVTLVRSERSPIAALVTEMLEDSVR